MFIALSKQDTIAHYTAQALSQCLGLLKVVNLGDQQFTEGLGAGNNDSFHISGSIESDESFMRQCLRPFLHKLEAIILEDGFHVASQPVSALRVVSAWNHDEEEHGGQATVGDWISFNGVKKIGYNAI